MGFDYLTPIAIIDRWHGQRRFNYFFSLRCAMEVNETIIVEKSTVSCDGGGGALGHPKIYLTIKEDGEIVCPYCSRTYKLLKNATKAIEG